MFSFGLLKSIGAANASALHTFGEIIGSSTLVAVSRTESLHHRSGETNRYTSHHYGTDRPKTFTLHFL
jgi:hypothetical protein